MVKELEDLRSVFRLMHDYASKIGIPLSVLPVTIYIWIDTHQSTCQAITGQAQLNFFGTIGEPRLFLLLRAIDKITPIFKILTEGYPCGVFHVSKTEAFMNKGCEC